jgi:hypothetical protein
MRFQPARDGIDKIAAAFAADRGNREHRTFPSVRLDEFGNARFAFVGVDQIGLVQHQPARLVVQRAVVAFELAHDRACAGDRIGIAIERREIDDVQQQSRALQVAQKLVAESRALGRTLDQSGNIGDDKAAVLVDANDAEIRAKVVNGSRRPSAGRPRSRVSASTCRHSACRAAQRRQAP